MIQELSSKEILEKIESGEEFVLDFYATWCGPCKMLMHILETSGHKMGVPVYKYNVDSDRQFTGSQNVRSVPTLKLYSEGIVKKTHTGVLQESQFPTFLN
jgi:thioredoxin 1